jgi:aspartate/methionine/tyrosine aminotransferase
VQIADFSLERYFARWEFNVQYVLCASDVEPLSLRELVGSADDETLELWTDLHLGYTEPLGHPLLRKEISELYETAAAEEVITFVGAEEAIFLTMHALLGAGDHAVVLWPAYQSLHEVARSIGASVTLVPLDPASWRFEPEAVLAAIRPTTQIVVVNFPHSPTGALADRAAFTYLTNEIEDRGITLFSDEVYRYLEVDEIDRLPAAVDVGRGAVSLGVMSKAFALAGLRVGWLATHDASLRTKISRLKDYTTICGSAPSEILSLMGLRQRDRVLSRSRQIIAGNLPLLDAFFARNDDRLHWVRPRAGSVAFPRLISSEAGAIDRLAAELVGREGVLLLPGSQFQYEGNHFRIGLGRTNLPQALERFQRFLSGSHERR